MLMKKCGECRLGLGGDHQKSDPRCLAFEPYPWPCDRRDAHHAGHLIAGRQRSAISGRLIEVACPGVPAHPLTMAGGSYALSQVRV